MSANNEALDELRDINKRLSALHVEVRKVRRSQFTSVTLGVMLGLFLFVLLGYITACSIDEYNSNRSIGQRNPPPRILP